MSTAKEVPQLASNVQLEADLLGGLLMRPDMDLLSIVRQQQSLQADAFYDHRHRIIFRAVCRIQDNGGAPELDVVGDELLRTGELAEAGGIGYLSEILQHAMGLPSLATSDGALEKLLPDYARRIMDHALLRRFEPLATAAVTYAYAGADVTVDEALGQIEAQLAELRQRQAARPGAKRSRFPFLSDHEIMDLQPAAGIVGNLLVEDTTACLYAREGRWKTFLALDWALSCATGRTWLGRPVKAGPVVYIAAEGAHGIGKRIAAWKVHHGLFGQSTAIKVLGKPVQLMDASEVRELIAEIRAKFDEDGPPVLVVVDTLARSMIGGDENSAKDINVVTAAAYAIKEAFGCCVLIVHHTGKDDSRGLRGSSALRSNADTVIRIAGNDTEAKIAPGEPITVICEKTKDDAPFDDITLTAQGVSVAKENGETFTSLVLVPADPAAARTAAPKLTENQQKVLDALAQVPDTVGMKTKEWKQETGLAERSFFDAVKVLRYRHGYVTYEEIISAYVVTAAGRKHVAAELQSAGDRSANDDARTAEITDDSVDEDAEFMGPEGTAGVRSPIVGPQSRSSPDGCSQCGGELYINPLGRTVCRRCVTQADLELPA